MYWVFRMTAPSNPLKMTVLVRDSLHFHDMNDYIAFQRATVKDYSWDHQIQDKYQSWLDIEFHNISDALLFKLKYG